MATVLAGLFASAGTFTVTSTNDSGAGSLREAIGLANADTTTPRIINFAIGTGLQTIPLASALPELAKRMTIDGTTQPGYAGTPLIVLDGNFMDADGLVVNYPPAGSSGPIIKGLCIVNFGANGGTPRCGIDLKLGDSATIAANFIGINAAGTAAARNTGPGIRVEWQANTIGGTTAANRNVISGNGGAGVELLQTGNFVPM